MASRRGQAKAAAPRADRDGTAGPAADRIRTGLARVIPAGPSAGPGRPARAGPGWVGLGSVVVWNWPAAWPGWALNTAPQRVQNRWPRAASPHAVQNFISVSPLNAYRARALESLAGKPGQPGTPVLAAAGAGPGSAPVVRRAASAPSSVQCCSGNSCPGRVVAKGQVNAVARTAGIAVLDRSTAVRALPGHSSAASPLGAEPPQTRCPAVSIGHDWPEKQRQLMTFQGLR